MRPQANAHVSDPGNLPAESQVAEWCGAMVAQHGFHEGRLQVGRDTQIEIQRLAAMRQALSRSARTPVLMIDVGATWTSAEAIRIIGSLERDFDLTCVEAPVDASDIQGLKRVSDGVYAAVCAGRNLYGVADYLPYFQQHAIDIVQINIRRTGVTAAQQIADTAYGLELPVTLCASPWNLAVHLAPAMPNFMSLEVTDPESSNELLASDIRIDNGRAIAGDSPGCGLAIDRAALAAAPHDRECR
jgi:L-alanine-DL-glutamate epimerase-like enolase superfamily enzyme